MESALSALGRGINGRLEMVLVLCLVCILLESWESIDLEQFKGYKGQEYVLQEQEYLSQ